MPAILDKAQVIETSAWGASAPPKIEDQEMDAIAFELWQRVSAEGESEVWLDAEESILSPH